jgi:hypothetical protein
MVAAASVTLLTLTHLIAASAGLLAALLFKTKPTSTEKEIAMSVATWFKKAGTDLDKFFGVIVNAGEDAEPIVDALDPAIAPVYNLFVGAAAKIEAVGQAVPTAGLSDEQKVAAIVTAIMPTVISTAQSRGVSAPEVAKVQAYVTAGLSSLEAFGNLFGSSSAAAQPAPAPAASASTVTVINAAPALTQAEPVPVATSAAQVAPGAAVPAVAQNGPGLATIVPQ